jgi:hypothetical protein
MKEIVKITEAAKDIHQYQSHIKHLIGQLEDASQRAQTANLDVVQLAWDLGDDLLKAKEEAPDTYRAMLDGIGVTEAHEKAWIRVRKSSETREELGSPNSMRQAMLAMVVPGKEQGEERVELCPPQTFFQWVNKSNSWLKKAEVGLVQYQKEQLKPATVRLYEFLKTIHE